MALNEEQQNKQSTQNWSTRVAQGRRELSVSVEEALEDSLANSLDEEGEPESAVRSAYGQALVPPRLSLQSRPMPAIHTGKFVEATAGPAQVQSADAKIPQPDTALAQQQPGRLRRLAQRLTSSLMAFGAASQVEAAIPLPPPSPEEPLLLARQQDASLLPPAPFIEEPPASKLPPEATKEATARPTFPPRPPASIPPSGLGTQRLAGRHTRIRLETAPIPATPHPLVRQVQQAAPEESPAPALEMAQTGTTSTHLSVVRMQAEDAVSTRLPVVAASDEAAPTRPARNELAGSGAFESGQADLTVLNPHVTASSVVYVTLTTNPGPVVVQYISLQPQIGFTIHLTAPTAMRTSFNYIVLGAELL